MLLDDIKQVVAICIVDLLAPRKSSPCSVDFQKGVSVEELDVKAVPADRKDLLAENNGLGLVVHVLIEDGNWRGKRLERRHD